VRYCFDIDGVICHTEGTDYHASSPNPEVIARINDLFEAGHTIVLQTARGMGTLEGDLARVHEAWYDFTFEQMKGFGLHFHALFLGKAFADVYVDDKGIGFERWMEVAAP
jgi:hypothetical protein